MLSSAASFIFLANKGGQQKAAALARHLLGRVLAAPAQAQTPDTTAPTLSSATANNTTLRLTYNEALDTSSVPEATAFTVEVDESDVSLSATNPVAVSGRVVTLTLANGVGIGKTVKVDYTVPGSNPIQDSAGNDAGALMDRSVTVNGICDRTPAVQTAILVRLSGITNRRDVTSSHLSGLTISLNISRVNLTSLQENDFDGLPKLNFLYLSQNSLSSLHVDIFSDLSSLNVLSLSNNSLSSLPEDIFNGLSGLGTLNLDNNSLSSLHEEIFDGLTSLRLLYLHDNSLRSLPEGLLSRSRLPSLNRLWLANNGLVCLPRDLAERSSIIEDAPEDLPDCYGVSLSVSPTEVSEGSGGESITVTATLKDGNRVKSEATTVTISVEEDTAIEGEDFEAVSDFAITIASGSSSSSGTFTLTARKDAVADDSETVKVTGSTGLSSSSVAGTEVEEAEVSIRNTPPGVDLSASSLTVEEGETGTYTVVLNTQPSGTVTITASSGDTTVATVTPPSLTFTTSNWDTPQTVTVSGVENDVPSEDRTIAVSHGISGGGYDSVAHVTVTVNDDDTARVRVSQESLSILEGESGSYTVVLNTQPTGTVTITASSSDRAVATVTPPSLTFTTGNWNTAQTVTVSGVENDDQSVTVSHGISGGGYGSISVPDVTVTVNGICDRTPAVQTAILGRISGITDCEDVTSSHLSRITGALGLTSTRLTSLQENDFDGLSKLDFLYLNRNSLSSLSENTFDGLSSLQVLTLSNNSLSSLPEDIFNDLTSLITFHLSSNSLSSLGEDIFDGLSPLKTLSLNDNSLSSLPEDIFEGLTALTDLWFHNNSLRSLPEGMFSSSRLPSLSGLQLANNGLLCLPRDLADRTSSSSFLTEEVVKALPDCYGVSLSVSPTEVSEGSGGESITVAATLKDGNRVRSEATTVTISVEEDTAIEGEDFEAVSDFAITIASGSSSSSGTFTLTAKRDLALEERETVKVTGRTGLSSSSVAGTEVEEAEVSIRNTRHAKVDSVAVTSTPRYWRQEASGTGANRRDIYGAGDKIAITLDFDMDVTVTGDPELVFSLGNRNAAVETNAAYDATLSAAAGSDKAVFSYTVRAADVDSNGIFLLSSAAATPRVTLDSDDAIVGATGGAAADLTWTTNATQSDHRVDGSRSGAAPVSLAVTSTAPLSGEEYGAGDVIAITLTFDRDVTVTGTPKLRFNIGGNPPEEASYSAGGSTARALLFTYAVQAGDSDDNGIFLLDGRDIASSDSAVVLESGATIRDMGTTTDADLVHPGRGQQNDHKVDGSRAGSGVSLSSTDLTVTEDGSGSYTVELNTLPTGSVTIVPSSNDSGAASISPATLTFSTANWNTAQTVTVSGVEDDNIASGDERVSISHTVGGYGDVSSADAVSVTVRDDDTAGVSISPTSLTLNEGDSDIYTVVLESEPTGTVTITPSSGDGGAATVSPSNLTFSSTTWNTPQTITVTALQDDDNEDETVAILHSVSGYGSISSGDMVSVTVRDDDEATGEAVIRAWLPRFGRSVAQQVVERVSRRLQQRPQSGLEVSVAGEQLTNRGPWEEEQGIMAKLLGFEAVSEGQLVEGTEFAFSPSQPLGEAEADGDGESNEVEDGNGEGLAFWGAGELSSFNGRQDTISLSATVTTALVAADWQSQRWQAGAALAHSWGRGSYEESSSGAEGQISSNLTGLFPYGRYALNDHLTLWGVVGHGWGQLTLLPQEGDQQSTSIEMSMAAVGLDGLLLDGGGSGLTIRSKADALLLGVNSEQTPSLAGVDGEVSRLRLGLEALRPFPMPRSDAVLTPSLALAIRQDGGDAETGFGLDLAASLLWSDPLKGMEVEVAGRSLLSHGDQAFQEQGLAASFSWDPNPSSPLGPSLSLSQSMGASASSGSDALLNPTSWPELETSTSAGEVQQFGARMGYGLLAYRDALLITPEVSLALSSDATITTLGFSLAPYSQQGYSYPWQLSLERQQHSSGNSDNPATSHSLQLRFSLLL